MLVWTPLMFMLSLLIVQVCAPGAAGGGIALAPCFILQPLIDAGRLRRVLPDWNTPHLPIHAVYPTRRHLSAKVQAMASFLKDWFAAQ